MENKNSAEDINVVEVILTSTNGDVKCVVDFLTYEKLLNDPEYRDNYATSLARKDSTNGAEMSLASSDFQENKQDRPTSVQSELPDFTPENSENSEDTDEDDDETRKWNKKTTKLLIENRLRLDEKFRNPKSKKSVYWKLILKVFLANNHIDFTVADLANKWKNILVTYTRNVDKSKRTGESAVLWRYFERLHEVLGKRRNVIPPESSLGSSMKSTNSTVSKTTNVMLSEKGQTKMQLTSKRTASVGIEDNCDSEKRKSTANEEKLQASKKAKAVKKQKMDTMTYLTDAIKEKNENSLAFKENLWKEKKDIEYEKINAIRELAAAIGSLKQK